VGSKKRKATGADLIKGKVKKKCCKSRPRCSGCPVVVARLTKAGAGELSGKDLERAVKRARAA
jgi:hypothetical protein